MSGGIGRTLLAGSAICALAACSSGSSTTGTATVPTGPSADLAPSQQTAVTAPRPDTPPACDPAVLAVWTAQVQLADEHADAVLRVRNDGDAWCEADIAGSPFVDPAIEFDVWLEPGSWADLVVGSGEDDCGSPVVVDVAEIDLNGASMEVETAAVVSCGWWLTAFYPNQVSDGPCEQLRAAVVDGAVLLRNDAVAPCRLGELVSVAGDGATTAPAEAALAVPVLAGGDVVALTLDVDDGACPARPVQLGFDSGTTVEVTLAGCAPTVGSGPPRPWIGGPGSPAVRNPSALLSALDPF